MTKPLFAFASFAALLIILQICPSPSPSGTYGSRYPPSISPSPSILTSSDCRTISTQGDYSLTSDIATGQDVCIKFEAGASGSTLDCRGRSLTSTANNYAGKGILIENAEDITVRNCVISGFGTGIYLGGARGSLIEDNSVSGATWGIRLTATPVGSEADGTLRSVSSEGNTIRNNQMRGNNYGIELRFANNNLIEGNNADGSRSTAFDIESADNNTIRNNHASSSYQGIYIDQSGGNVFVNNTATGNSANYDISCASDSSDNSASGNTCEFTNCDWLTCTAPS